MPPHSTHPELSHTCDHPHCCGHGTPDTETLVANSANAMSEREETRGVSRWDSLKRSILWFLAFFGIYASSSVYPFCGTPGCPVGVGGAAVVAGAFAACGSMAKVLGRN